MSTNSLDKLAGQTLVQLDHSHHPHHRSFFQLTYCTNIHPGDGWAEVFANLQQYAPALKGQLSPDAPFGIGLRLSSDESKQLLEGERLAELSDFLTENNLYVALINGFPFGSFHRRAIKEDVFAPDWKTPERVAYTLRLIEILRHLLPKELDGGVSTLPLSYKRWVAADDHAAWQQITGNIVRIAERLVDVKQQDGLLIHLDIEPEPDGLIENSRELLAFYQNWLLPFGAPLLAGRLQISREQAQQFLLDHIQVCFDTCHFAVEFENPEQVLREFSSAGIKVGRVQISSALKVTIPSEGPNQERERTELAHHLQHFAESTYLHQVVEQQADGALRNYSDLGLALTHIHTTKAKEWRIHFHVPLFVENYGAFGSTQGYIQDVFKLLQNNPFTRHLEIETYTWDVLPPRLKQDLLKSIRREYRWVMGELTGAS